MCKPELRHNNFAQIRVIAHLQKINLRVKLWGKYIQPIVNVHSRDALHITKAL